MSIRTSLFVTLVCGLAAALPAQEQQPPVKPVPPAQPDVVKPAQDPQGPPPPAVLDDKPRPRELTPEERVARLKAELEQLKKELAYVNDRGGQIVPMIADKLAAQAKPFEPTKIDAGTSKAMAAPVVAPQPSKAVVAVEGETAMPEHAALTVNGRPVTQAAIDELIAHLKQLPDQGPDDLLGQRALMELIRIEVAHAAFAKDAEVAQQQILTVQKELQDGADFAAVAKAHSKGPGAENGGAIGAVTRNSPHGLALERAAFTTKAGEVSAVFRTPQGFCVLRADKANKGDTPAADNVECSLILVPFTADLAALRQAQAAVATGQVEIVLRDEKMREMLPVQFR